MFENLSERLEAAFKQIKGEGRITELNIAATVKDIRRALIDADVNYKIAKEFTDTVREKALGQKVLTAVSPGQLMVKVVKDELVELMGGSEAEFNAKGSPAVILIAGLQGSGKTTFSGKLANYLKTRKGLSPLLVAADIYRPAAIEQLRVLGEQIGVDVYSEPENKNAVEIAQNAVREARSKNKNVVIVDTAGRLAIDEVMMQEVAAVKAAVNPGEILFVVDSMTGQDAVNTAKAFNDRLDFTGVVLTKLDGDTRGGAALSIKYTVAKPIKFISQRGEDGYAGCFLSRADGAADPGDGGYHDAGGEGAGAVRRGGGEEAGEEDPEEPVRFRGFHAAAGADQEDGKYQGPAGDDPGGREGSQGHRYQR